MFPGDERWTLFQRKALSGDYKEFLDSVSVSQLLMETVHGSSVLHFAVNGGNIEILKFIIDASPVLLFKANHFGETPLHWASKFSTKDIVKLLLRNGACPERQDNDGNTALHWAAEYDNIDATKLLLSYGSPAQQKNEDGHTPYNVAKMEGSTKCRKFLRRRRFRI
mmetsp:Transcript_13929/g.17511  ORF Transcript_13929/g.17511 Transcript_13929/m.17511 type:complete len:166 (-) Transcript_13929:16-513(-)